MFYFILFLALLLLRIFKSKKYPSMSMSAISTTDLKKYKKKILMSSSEVSPAVALSSPSSFAQQHRFIFQSPQLKKLFEKYKQEQQQKETNNNCINTANRSSFLSSSICEENDYIVKTKTLPISKTKTLQVLPPDNDVAKKVTKIVVAGHVVLQKSSEVELQQQQQQLATDKPFSETHIIVVNLDTVSASLCLLRGQQQSEQGKTKQEQENDKGETDERDVCFNKQKQTYANTVVALSFANAENPGGYYRAGARAQEEDLCRTIPELYDSLIVGNCKFYPILPCEALLSQDLFLLRAEPSVSANYSIREEVIRNAPSSSSASVSRDSAASTSSEGGDKRGGEGTSNEQSDPHDVTCNMAPSSFFDSVPKISIITAAMPRGLGDKRPAGGFLNPESEWYQTVTLRIRAVLTAAKASGRKDLVLGSFGCGAYNNNPKYVAEIFKEQLTRSPEFIGCFDRVVFAIVDPMGTGNLRPFADVFASK